jgi:hypothetical protein
MSNTSNPINTIPVGGRTLGQQEWKQTQNPTLLNPAARNPTNGEKEHSNLPGVRGELDQHPIPMIHPGVTRHKDGKEKNERRLSPVVDHPHRNSNPKPTFFMTTATNAFRKPIGQHRTTWLFKQASEKMGS